MKGLFCLLYCFILNTTYSMIEEKATLPGDKLTVIVLENSRQTTSLRVNIQEILPDGTYLIAGRQSITSNGSNQYINISGIVRPEDISSNNTVLSTQIIQASMHPDTYS